MDANKRVSMRERLLKVLPLFLSFVLIEVVSIIVGSGLSALFEREYMNSGLGWWTAEKAQGVLPNRAPDDVRVIDISGLKRIPTRRPDLTATSRSEMIKLIGEVSKAGPKGIAVDVDFSMEWVDSSGQIIDHASQSGNPFVGYTLDGTESNIPVEELDLSFHSNLRKLNLKKVPVFLGVARQVEQKCDRWFGESDQWGCNYGGSMYFLRDTTVVIPRSHRLNKEGAIVQTLSNRLAALAPSNRPAKSLLLEDEVKTTYGDAEFDSALVDYTPLLKIKPISGAEIVRRGIDVQTQSDLKDKLVLIGNSNLDKSDPRDLYLVPNHGETFYPGVLVHACATQTLVAWPLSQFTHLGGFVTEFVLFEAAALVLFFFELRLEHDQKKLFRIWLLINAITVAITCGVYLSVAREFRVIWVGLTLVLLIHLILQSILKVRQSRLHRKQMPEAEEGPRSVDSQAGDSPIDPDSSVSVFRLV